MGVGAPKTDIYTLLNDLMWFLVFNMDGHPLSAKMTAKSAAELLPRVERALQELSEL